MFLTNYVFLFPDQKKPVGKVIGIDLLPIDPLPGAILLPGCDFTSQETLKKIADLLQNCGDPSLNSQPVGVDIILSDMGKNFMIEQTI